MSAVPAWPAADRVPQPYCTRYVGENELAAGPEQLAAVRFGARVAASGDRIDVPLEVLAGEACGEVWRSRSPVQRHAADGIAWADNGTVLMASCVVPEQELGDVEAAAFSTYARLVRVLERSGYPHALRIWNYLSDINLGEGDAERYRRFSAGRYRALARAGDFERFLPAASAIGTPGGSGLQVYLLAARSPGVQIENPRQVSAFRYPPAYGPRSPSFSRAMLMHWQDRSELLVSGTASIVGHESRHPGDPQAQLEQTVRNLEALLENAQAAAPTMPRLRPAQCKLYLRRPEDLAAIAPRMRALFPDTPSHVLRGDICRRELLLELEAVYSTEPL